MKTYIVVEGPVDAALMRPLIAAARIPSVETVDAGGKSSATSLANSIAVSRQSPVAVVVDADTTDEQVLKEQRLVFLDLQRFAPPNTKSRLFLGVPTLEEDLFPDAETFASIYKLDLNPTQRERFHKNRIAAIRSMMMSAEPGQPLSVRHGRMDPAAAKRGFDRPLLRDLFAFLRDPRKLNREGFHA